MGSRSVKVAVVCVAAIILPVVGVLGYPGKVLQTVESPGGFCTGLAFDGRCLWVADYKADRLFRVRPDNGEVVKAIPSPGFWPAGVAWDGKRLWVADSGSRKVYGVDPADGTIVRVLDAPARQPAGLAWDGQALWLSDTKNRKIVRLDMSDGTAVKMLSAPADAPGGLTFDGRYLWCADRIKDELYMVEPGTGDVAMILDAPGPYARGMAWDGQSLWVVDYQNDDIDRVVRRDDETYRLTNPRRARVMLTHQVKVDGQGGLKTLQVCLAVPEEMPQQAIRSVRYEPEPSIETDRWGQKVAVFRYRDVPDGATIESVMVVEAEISDIRYFIVPEGCGTLNDIPAEIRSRYTADGTKYRIKEPYIRNLAAKVIGREKNPYVIARKAFDHVRRALEYKLEGGWNTAPVVLQRGTGSCSEYSFSFIALCRAAGLPARYVGSLVVRGDDASLDDVFHRWPEVYLPHYGWVPIDPQGGDRASTRDRAMHIGNLSNRFLITTQGGGDSKYLGWYYNCHETYTSAPQVNVHVEAFAEWEPLE